MRFREGEEDFGGLGWDAEVEGVRRGGGGAEEVNAEGLSDGGVEGGGGGEVGNFNGWNH